MKVFFIAGEDSGDALGAPLIRSLNKKLGEQVNCIGVGGNLMASEKFELLLPMDQISVIGIWEVLPKIPRLIKIHKAIIEEIEARQPDVLVTIDFPDFNFFLARSLKKRGVFKGKIIHYVAPSVWAWRPGRAKKISGFLDGIMCLFPMEVDYFTPHNLPAVHVGHPLVCSDVDNANGKKFRQDNSIPDDARTIGLFFGSRESEFKALGDIIKQAMQLINDVEKNLFIIVPTLPHLEYEVGKILEGFPLKTYVTSNPITKWDAFKACDVAISVSGTVALELAYAGVPHVVGYKLSVITGLIIKALIKVKHIHLANILLGKEVVPECLQMKCNPEKLAEEILELYKDEERRENQINEFKKLKHILMNHENIDPSDKAAEFIINSTK